MKNLPNTITFKATSRVLRVLLTGGVLVIAVNCVAIIVIMASLIHAIIAPSTSTQSEESENPSATAPAETQKTNE